MGTARVAVGPIAASEATRIADGATEITGTIEVAIADEAIARTEIIMSNRETSKIMNLRKMIIRKMKIRKMNRRITLPINKLGRTKSRRRMTKMNKYSSCSKYHPPMKMMINKTLTTSEIITIKNSIEVDSEATTMTVQIISEKIDKKVVIGIKMMIQKEDSSKEGIDAKQIVPHSNKIRLI